jgi:hypothetical protein
MAYQVQDNLFVSKGHSTATKARLFADNLGHRVSHCLLLTMSRFVPPALEPALLLTAGAKQVCVAPANSGSVVILVMRETEAGHWHP